MLLAVGDAPKAEQLSWLLLPLIGAVMASIGAFLFNPYPEDRREIGGRMIVGVFCGVCLPNIMFYCSDTLQKASAIPAVQLLLGFAICSFFYLVSKPLFRGAYKRSDDWANAGLDKLEERAGILKSDKESEHPKL